MTLTLNHVCVQIHSSCTPQPQSLRATQHSACNHESQVHRFPLAEVLSHFCKTDALVLLHEATDRLSYLGCIAYSTCKLQRLTHNVRHTATPTWIGKRVPFSLTIALFSWLCPCPSGHHVGSSVSALFVHALCIFHAQTAYLLCLLLASLSSNTAPLARRWSRF